MDIITQMDYLSDLLELVGKVHQFIVLLTLLVYKAILRWLMEIITQECRNEARSFH